MERPQSQIHRISSYYLREDEARCPPSPWSSNIFGPILKVTRLSYRVLRTSLSLPHGQECELYSLQLPFFEKRLLSHGRNATIHLDGKRDCLRCEAKVPCMVGAGEHIASFSSVARVEWKARETLVCRVLCVTPRLSTVLSTVTSRQDRIPCVTTPSAYMGPEALAR